MYRPLIAASLLMLSGVATAQTQPAQSQPGSGQPATAQSASDRQAESGKAPERVRSVTLNGTDKCPESTDTEIVVCQTVADPYRIPKAFREPKKDAAQQSWVNRAATMDQVGRVAGGLPDTCSPVGSGGQSGCALQLNRAFAAEKRQAANDAASVP